MTHLTMSHRLWRVFGLALLFALGGCLVTDAQQGLQQVPYIGLPMYVFGLLLALLGAHTYLVSGLRREQTHKLPESACESEQVRETPGSSTPREEK